MKDVQEAVGKILQPIWTLIIVTGLGYLIKQENPFKMGYDPELDINASSDG